MIAMLFHEQVTDIRAYVYLRHGELIDMGVHLEGARATRESFCEILDENPNKEIVLRVSYKNGREVGILRCADGEFELVHITKEE